LSGFLGNEVLWWRVSCGFVVGEGNKSSFPIGLPNFKSDLSNKLVVDTTKNCFWFNNLNFIIIITKNGSKILNESVQPFIGFVVEEISLYLFFVSLDKTHNGLSTTLNLFGPTFNFIWIVTITSWTRWSRPWVRLIVAASG